MVKVVRQDSDSDEEIGVRKKQQKKNAAFDSDEEIGVREKQQKKNAAFFAICIIVIAALIIAILAALGRFDKCPRAGTITQCATKYEMIDGVEFTSEVNCTTVKEERNCKPGRDSKNEEHDDPRQA